jgi:hypothetical protein
MIFRTFIPNFPLIANHKTGKKKEQRKEKKKNEEKKRGRNDIRSYLMKKNAPEAAPILLRAPYIT